MLKAILGIIGKMITKKMCNELPSDYIAAEAAWLAANAGTGQMADRQPGVRRERRAVGDLPVPRVRGESYCACTSTQKER